MYILVAGDGEISLRESDNMRSFSIVEEKSGMAVERLATMAVAAEDNHYWLDADVVLGLSGRSDDQQWVEGFWKMLAAVEVYGYSDMAKKQVKAHVEQGS